MNGSRERPDGLFRGMLPSSIHRRAAHILETDVFAARAASATSTPDVARLAFSVSDSFACMFFFIRSRCTSTGRMESFVQPQTTRDEACNALAGSPTVNPANEPQSSTPSWAVLHGA